MTTATRTTAINDGVLHIDLSHLLDYLDSGDPDYRFEIDNARECALAKYLQAIHGSGPDDEEDPDLITEIDWDYFYLDGETYKIEPVLRDIQQDLHHLNAFPTAAEVAAFIREKIAAGWYA